jgi:hypothetical protein
MQAQKNVSRPPKSKQKLGDEVPRQGSIKDAQNQYVNSHAHKVPTLPKPPWEKDKK